MRVKAALVRFRLLEPTCRFGPLSDVVGLGYGLDRLADVPWLAGKDVYYWGDIDTHGFAILDRLRAALPHARSFLMDRETLLAHRALWTREASPYAGPLPRLTDDERQLVSELRRHAPGGCPARAGADRIRGARAGDTRPDFGVARDFP